MEATEIEDISSIIEQCCSDYLEGHNEGDVRYSNIMIDGYDETIEEIEVQIKALGIKYTYQFINYIYKTLENYIYADSDNYGISICGVNDVIDRVEIYILNEVEDNKTRSILNKI